MGRDKNGWMTFGFANLIRWRERRILFVGRILRARKNGLRSTSLFRDLLIGGSTDRILKSLVFADFTIGLPFSSQRYGKTW